MVGSAVKRQISTNLVATEATTRRRVANISSNIHVADSSNSNQQSNDAAPRRKITHINISKNNRLSDINISSAGTAKETEPLTPITSKDKLSNQLNVSSQCL